MGIDPPFLYSQPATFKFDAGSSDRGFNPRAATDAAWVQAQNLREKRLSEMSREGPLIDRNQLNKHPDSYMVVPSAYLDFKPMTNGNRRTILWVRWVQLALRIISLVGSIGLMVCLVFVKITGDGSDWILRIPPGIAILHSLYAVWHLSKKATARTPASTASYFIFACIFDAGLIPFMIYTTMNTRNEWLLAQDNVEGHWTTLFGDGSGWPEYTLQATWIDAGALGCIWIVTFCMCFYLAGQFKKISNLPPDMNPLEENLTSKSKHKKTKSTITHVTDTESNRDSMASLLNEKGPQVPWLHTRNGSTSTLGTSSPPKSPRHSRYESMESLTPPRSPYTSNRAGNDSPRNSTISVDTTHRRQGHVRTDSNGDTRGLSPSPDRHSKPSSPFRSSALNPGRSGANTPTRNSIYNGARSSRSTLRLDSPTKNEERGWPGSPPTASENWTPAGYTADDGSDEYLIPKPLDTSPPEFQHLRHGRQGPSHDNLAARTAVKYDFSNRSPKPLAMNPPTPPVNHGENANGNAAFRSNRASRATKVREALQPTNEAANRGLEPASAENNWVDNYNDKFVNSNDADKESSRPMLQSKWGSPGRKSTRVISSGYEEQGLRQGAVKQRQVSGEVVDEGGRGSVQAHRAEMGWA